MQISTARLWDEPVFKTDSRAVGRERSTLSGRVRNFVRAARVFEGDVVAAWAGVLSTKGPGREFDVTQNVRSRGIAASVAVAALAIVVLGAPAFGQERTEVRDFAAGGSLRLTMRVGDVRIVKGRDAQHIRLYYTARSDNHDERREAKASLSFDVKGSTAEIEFSAPHDVNFEAELEVPSPTNLDVRLKVGDLRVEEVEGNKDLDVDVGDIRVDVGGKPDYSTVEARTHIGDVTAAAFGEPHGWLGKSLRYHGSGQYRLTARTGIGDVNLY